LRKKLGLARSGASHHAHAAGMMQGTPRSRLQVINALRPPLLGSRQGALDGFGDMVQECLQDLGRVLREHFIVDTAQHTDRQLELI
jgi:hypothetical protein